MTILELIKDSETTWEQVLQEVKKNAIDVEQDIDEYNGDRQIRDSQVGNRPNKIKADGSQIPVSKIAIPFNRKIVKSAASFLFGKPVNLASKEDISEIKAKWRKLRMDLIFLKLCELSKAYRKSALLFLIEKYNTELVLKTKIFDPSKADFHAYINDFEEMEAFLYSVKVKNDDDEDVTTHYLYTAELLIILIEDKDGLENIETIKHGFGRIPVVYVEEDSVEYEYVKPLIDRYEMRYSKFADTNDYFSSPFFKAKGSVDINPSPDDTGIVYELDVVETDQGNLISADVDVISWDAAPQATKLELELSKKHIYELSDTPDLTLEEVKGLGNVAGTAMELMFLGPIIKANFAEKIYKQAVYRALNLLQIGMALENGSVLPEQLNEEIQVHFTSILPDNILETVQMLTDAAMNKPILSQDTAVRKNPLVDDAEDELGKLNSEKVNELGSTFDI